LREVNKKTSRGCNKCDESGGTRIKVIRWLIQESISSTDISLPYPSQRRRRHSFGESSLLASRMLNPMESMEVISPATSLRDNVQLRGRSLGNKVFPFEENVGRDFIALADTHSMAVTHSCRPG